MKFGQKRFVLLYKIVNTGWSTVCHCKDKLLVTNSRAYISHVNHCVMRHFRKTVSCV